MLRPDLQALSFAKVQDRVAYRSKPHLQSMQVFRVHVCIRQTASGSPGCKSTSACRSGPFGKALLREWASAVKNSQDVSRFQGMS